MFDLSLNLKSMKEMIGWDDRSFRELHIDPYDGRLHPGSEPALAVIQREGEAALPCRATLVCELLHSEFGPVCDDSEKYYTAFLARVLPTGTKLPEYVEKNLHTVLDEAGTNTIRHGSDECRGKFMTIENYHPKNPRNMILRISNPYARTWDYESEVKNKMWIYVDKELGRVWEHGTGWINRMQGVSASYENEGRDFLALFDLLNVKL